MQDDPDGEVAGEVGGVDQADHTADDADQGQGGLIDGAARGTCCWERIQRKRKRRYTEGGGGVGTRNGGDV